MSDLIYSHIRLCQTLCFTQGKTRPNSVSEKSKFLSSLALLLNGDSSCTAIYVNQSEKIVLVARNHPISTQDRRYFDRFFGLIRIYSNICFEKEKADTLTDVDNLLRSLIYEYNAKKIIKRLVSSKAIIIDRLRKLIGSSTNQTPFIDELRLNSKLYRHKSAIAEKIYLISQNRTDEEYVQFLFHRIKQFLVSYDELIENQTNPTAQQFQRATFAAVDLYQSRLFLFILKSISGKNDDGIYYFEKITAHVRSLNLILKCLLHRKNDVGEIYKKINWKLIPAVEKEEICTVSPKEAFEILFNDLSSSSSSSSNLTSSNTFENVTSEDFYQQHLTGMSLYDRNGCTSMHVHAEILLVDYLLKNGINETNGSNDVEIGISKMPCLLCSYYIHELNIKYNRCFFSSQLSNGKIYGKWLLRDVEDSLIIQSIDEKLTEKLKQAIQKLCLHSDRFGAKKSDDSDVMLTSIEEDEFDQKFSGKVDETLSCYVSLVLTLHSK